MQRGVDRRGLPLFHARNRREANEAYLLVSTQLEDVFHALDILLGDRSPDTDIHAVLHQKIDLLHCNVEGALAPQRIVGRAIRSVQADTYAQPPEPLELLDLLAGQEPTMGKDVDPVAEI